MATSIHPAAPHTLPFFLPGPDGSDPMLVVMGVSLVVIVAVVGVLMLRLHTLPERMAHKSQKLQFEIVAVLGLIALFTHMHIFWIAGLILALIDLPDFGTPLRRIAGSAEKLAGLEPGRGDTISDEKMARMTAEERAGEAPGPDAPPIAAPAGGHAAGHGH